MTQKVSSWHAVTLQQAVQQPVSHCELHDGCQAVFTLQG